LFLDTDPVGLKLFVILLMIFANGLLAMAEIAIVSSRRMRLEILVAEGTRGAKAALALANDPNQLLAVVQIGITLIGVLTGAFGGATLAAGFAKYLNNVAVLAAYSETLSLVIVVAGITFFSLLIGEMVPKKVGLNNPEPIACMLAVPMRLLAQVAAPLVKIISFLTESIINLFGLPRTSETAVTEEEIKVLIAEGARNGTFEESEKEMVDKVFRLGDMKISGLMRPRTQLEWLDTEDSEDNNFHILIESGYSCFPVARGSLDEVLGVVYAKDLLAGKLLNGKLDIEAALKAPLYVPKSVKVMRMLEMFKQSGNHISFVIDEYGGFQGIVTLDDIMEELIGDVVIEDTAEEPEIILRDDGSWLMDGMLGIEELKEFSGVDELPGEDRDHFQTLGGFVVSYFGYIPEITEGFEWNGMRFEVVDMDRVRVDKVLVSKIFTTESVNGIVG